jgi:ankyrin repeat protein
VIKENLKKLGDNIPDLPPAKMMKLSRPAYVDTKDKEIVYDYLEALMKGFEKPVMMKGFEEPVKLFINSVMFLGLREQYDDTLMSNIKWIDKPTHDDIMKLILIFNGVNQIMDPFIDFLKDLKSSISPANTTEIQLNQHFSDRMEDLFRLVRMTIYYYEVLEKNIKYTDLIEDKHALSALQKYRNGRYIHEIVRRFEEELPTMDIEEGEEPKKIENTLTEILKVIDTADLEYTPIEDELLTFPPQTFRSQRQRKPNWAFETQQHDTSLMAVLRSLSPKMAKECSELFISHKANVNAVNKRTGDTPLMIVSMQSYHLKVPEIIELLVANGADVNAVNKVDGQTPLLCALSNITISGDVIESLLSNGAKVDVVDSSGRNTLMIGFPSFYVIRLLMDIKPDEKYPNRLPANINARTLNGETPLMYAASISHTKYYDSVGHINELLIRGANKNLKNNEGDTAYLIACRLSRDPEVVKQLYLPNKQANNKGETPFMLICDNIDMDTKDKLDLMKYLSQKGGC